MSNKARILLVDDDPGLLHLLRIRLTTTGYEVEAVASGEQALARLCVFRPQLVITDLRMEGMDGMALFALIHAQHPTLPVLILTAHGTIPDAVGATQRGVFGYLTKPYDSKELLEWVNKALRIAAATRKPEETDLADSHWRRDILTRSAAMEALLGQVWQVAQSEASVLLQGANGTGKELLARAIHRASRRTGRPFVPVNCTAIPESLLESELFGHNKGSFTGTIRDHQGLFQAAQGGTLFLDEIGDMPQGVQAKLLRSLQEKEVRPVGSTRTLPVDVRIISATHRELEQEVANGRFREDLYYRLNVVRLTIPLLSERREDIPLLVAHFRNKLQGDAEQRVRGFAPEAMELLIEAPWPGNVRQLQNIVEQTLALATTPIIPASLVQSALREKPAETLSLTHARERFEREYLVRLLQTTQGNVSHAARLARRERSKFYQLLRRYDLDPDRFRASD
ncbi:MAG: sigma 54-interacting transcriptional regulator [Pseudomonadota bacterium]|nr:sigma 54-interacting transcriptional regulator [Pseudomonadota bacterium]